MEFFQVYFELIDILAIVALVGLVVMAFVRRQSVWFGLMLVVVGIWAARRLFGWF